MTTTSSYRRNAAVLIGLICAAVTSVALILGPSASAQATAGAVPKSALLSPNPKLVKPGAVHLAGDETAEEAAPIVEVAQTLYTFWNTGKSKYLLDAVAPSFHDNTLPAGRPQGRGGILLASHNFRLAVPNLRCKLENLWVTGDTFTAQLIFSGNFNGTLEGIPGTGQPIRFNAIDIQHVGPAGRIIEDWHIEDNLTFMKQAGVIP